MPKVFDPHAVALLAAVPGSFVASDSASLVAFMANEKLATVYQNVPQVELLMLSCACSIGATISSLVCGRVCAYIGALSALRVASLLWLAGCLGSFFAATTSQVVLWKLAKGLGSGLAGVASILYIFEVLDSPHRAISVAWRMLFSVLAQQVLYGVASILRIRLSPPVAFHYVWVAEAAWGVTVIAATCFLPQTPAVLVRRGQWVRAQAVYAKLTRGAGSGFGVWSASPGDSSRGSSSVGRAKRSRPVDEQSSSPTPTSEIRSPVRQSIQSEIQRSPPESTSPQCSTQGWFRALGCLQLAQLLSILVSPFFWRYLGAFCSLSTLAVELWFHASYALQLLFSAVPCILLKSAHRPDSISMGFTLMAAAYITVAVLAFIYSYGSTSTPPPYMLSHTVTNFPASSILALTAFAVSVYSSLVAATLTLYAAESLTPSSRARGLSVAASTAHASGAFITAGLVYLHVMPPAAVFTVMAVVMAGSAGLFLFCPDSLQASMQEHVPFPLVPLADSASVELRDMDDSGENDGDKNRGRDSKIPVPTALDAAPVPSESPASFQCDQTQNFIRLDTEGHMQRPKPSGARTVATLATAKTQFTEGPAVTAMTWLPDEPVSLGISRSASTSTNKEVLQGLWTSRS